MPNPDDDIKPLLQTGKKREALSWLREFGEKNMRNIGEMEPSASLAIVQKLYEMGAREVIATQINSWEGYGENTDYVVIVLPEGEAARKKFFGYEAQRANEMGYAPTPDHGQKLMLLGYKD